MKKRLMNIKNAACLLLSLVFLAACSSSGDKTTARPQVHTVEIRQMQFIPAELKVKKGDEVVFVNKDIVAHNVTEQTGRSWSSSLLQNSESWTLVVTASSDYYCSIHPVMKGKITAE